MLASALWRVGERIDERIRRRTAGGMSPGDLRTAVIEPLLMVELATTTTDQRHLAKWARAILDEHIAALAPAPAPAPERRTPARRP